MYHGILIDKEFKDPPVINSFKIFNKKKSTDFDGMLFGIEVEDKKLSETINFIQENLIEDKPFYVHLYNNNKLIVIFKRKIFHVTVDTDTWKDFVIYGKSLGIPEKQLKISPIRFEEEVNYFNM